MTHTNIDSSGAGRGTYRSYGIGFVLSIVLTVVAFGAVMSGVLSRPTEIFVIFGVAIAQILVHLYYFLHLNTSSSARWNLLAMIFTVLIIVLFVGGSIWIMSNLGYRMM